LNVGAVRPSIGQALANDALGQLFGALAIVHAKRNAVVMVEIKFRQITVQMFLGTMLVVMTVSPLQRASLEWSTVS
jgi:hypothetical protein